MSDDQKQYARFGPWTIVTDVHFGGATADQVFHVGAHLTSSVIEELGSNPDFPDVSIIHDGGTMTGPVDQVFDHVDGFRHSRIVDRLWTITAPQSETVSKIEVHAAAVTASPDSGLIASVQIENGDMVALVGTVADEPFYAVVTDFEEPTHDHPSGVTTTTSAATITYVPGSPGVHKPPPDA